MTETPLMAQWRSCKERAKDALLLFRLGDFYEAFHEDAQLISREIDLTLTKRQEVPMCGVPFHSCETYIDRLISKGYKVAIAEQLEDPKSAKGLVKRAIVRTLTPGTLVTSTLLNDKTNNFLAALTQINACFGLAVLDLTTSDFRVYELEDKRELLDELSRLRPAEILLSEKLLKSQKELFSSLKESFPFSLSSKEQWNFDPEHALTTLLNHFHLQTLDGFGLKGMNAAISAAGALLSYVSLDLQLPTEHIEKLQKESLSSYMSLDRTTEHHLELITSATRRKEATLLSLIDRTATPMGGREIKRWITHPLLDLFRIQERQEAISDLLLRSKELSFHLEKIRDLERLIMRISSGYATARDLQGLRLSLEEVPPVASLLRPLSSSLIQKIVQRLKDLTFLTEKIKGALVDAPPLRLSEGGLFRSGYHPELDELRSLLTDSQTWIARYQTLLREQTGLKTLKVGYTQAFGYYIEVSRTQAPKMPSTFHRRQTLVHTERFISPELKEYEVKVLSAEERISQLEQSLFHQLRSAVAEETQTILDIASALATLDCLNSLAHVAKERHFVCPAVDEGAQISITAGRHPVIEEGLKKETFIPNDTLLNDQESRLMLITGPNMAGKSTYMRQVALIVILAQIGSFVPAKAAKIGIVDKLFTRIGASDDLSRGQSTFMVEMAETANILNNATPRSLIILDEIGRGTSTFDGISIAAAVAEYLLTHPEKGAKTLFATHYWELTELEEKIPGAINYNVSVKETGDGILFLHKIERGAANKSYGIHVAKLAGLPPSILRRAEERLKKLEKQPALAQRSCNKSSSSVKNQLSLFDATL
ncbi:MAG: DNA mismatch repair protein MutS [Chlamydiae bacterium RIFCSPLOWO2_12_FULL_49_12]|nr:MAG: DNA mismatch repair protein MutS [Chlamydiae bacterium RIFCSPLOWO2_12_FULL_49_12]